MAARATARRGELEVPEGAVDGDGAVADAYLSVRGWTMGLAWVNGFNLGWYWPARGPANTMCARRPPSALALCAMRPGTGWAFSRAHGTCPFSGWAVLPAASGALQHGLCLGSAARLVPGLQECFAGGHAVGSPGSGGGGSGGAVLGSPAAAV
jgi:hypothetical protein